MDSVTYLGLASLIIWAVFFSYLFILRYRQRKLAARLDELARRTGLEGQDH